MTVLLHIGDVTILSTFLHRYNSTHAKNEAVEKTELVFCAFVGTGSSVTQGAT